MRKIISVLAVALFTFSYAQETPKKSCCSGKDAKECTKKKKTAKACTTKDHKNCKSKDCKEKAEVKKAA